MLDKLKNIQNLIKALLIGSVLCSCGDDISERYQGDYANILLASTESIKSWVRVSRSEDGQSLDISDCEDTNSLIFIRTTTADTLFLINRIAECGDGIDSLLLYTARYSVDEDAQGNFTDGITMEAEAYMDINFMEVEQLTSKYLRVNYTVDGVKIVESYEEYE